MERGNAYCQLQGASWFDVGAVLASWQWMFPTCSGEHGTSCGRSGYCLRLGRIMLWVQWILWWGLGVAGLKAL